MATRHRLIDWEGTGYFGAPAGPQQYDYTSADEARLWTDFDAVLTAAKRGDFSGAMRLLTIYDSTDSWLLSAACSELIGDIGSRNLFDQIRPAVTAVIEPTYSVDLGRSLAIWGNLTVVPTLLDTLTAIADFVDAPALVQMISVLLEPEPGPLGDIDRLRDISSYAADAIVQRDALASRFGTDDAIVMFGERFSVNRLVDVMRGLLVHGGRFDPYLRHKFEATTGTDCSGFYKDGILQPLQALATLEAFEDEGDVAKYAPGRRYFFDHPVPD